MEGAPKPSRDTLNKRFVRWFDTYEPRGFDFPKPSNLSLSFLRSVMPEKVKDPDQWMAFALYIFGAITSLSARGKFIRGSRTYVPLHTPRLRKVMHNSYRGVLDWLEENGVLESKEGYLKGIESRGHRFTDAYRKSGHNIRTISHEGVKKKLIEEEEAWMKGQREHLQRLLHLSIWFHPKSTLDIDVKAADHFLQMYRKTLLSRAKDSKEEELDEAVSDYVESVMSRAKNDVIRLLRRDPKDLVYVKGRLYSPLTSMMKPLRHFLRYKGEPLVALDIKTSQPLHLLLFFKQEFWEHKEPWSLYKLEPKLYEKIEREVKETTSSLFFMYTKRGPVPSSKTDNQYFRPRPASSDFVELIRDGDLYQELSDKFRDGYKDKSGSSPFATRSSAKGATFHMMYFDPSVGYSRAAGPFGAFAEEFPREAALMGFLKKRFYKDLPRLLHKVEGYFLLERVCKEIADANPEIPLFTIHDSILTTEKHLAEVKKIAEAVYTEVFGFTPHLKPEDLGEAMSFKEYIGYAQDKLKPLLGDEQDEEFSDELDYLRAYHTPKILAKRAGRELSPPFESFTMLEDALKEAEIEVPEVPGRDDSGIFELDERLAKLFDKFK